MTNNVYNLLYRPRRLDREIGRINAKIESLKYSLMVSGIRYDKASVQSSSSDRMADVIAEIDDLEQRRDALIAERITAIDKIEKAARNLKDDSEYTVIYMQYIGKDGPQKIADTIPCSIATYYRIRKKALEHIGTEIKDDRNDNLNAPQ